MGGANTGRSNEDEEANPPEELHRMTPTTSIARTTQGHNAPNTESLWGRLPKDIQLLYHAR
jgi:hypothetical protein